jgi:hypothetical protein
VNVRGTIHTIPRLISLTTTKFQNFTMMNTRLLVIVNRFDFTTVKFSTIETLMPICSTLTRHLSAEDRFKLHLSHLIHRGRQFFQVCNTKNYEWQAIAITHITCPCRAFEGKHGNSQSSIDSRHISSVSLHEAVTISKPYILYVRRHAVLSRLHTSVLFLGIYTHSRKMDARV